MASAEDPFSSNAPTGTGRTDSLPGPKPFHIGPDTSTTGREPGNATANGEQSGGNPATAWDDAVRHTETAIGE